jgi:hypothetical protein
MMVIDIEAATIVVFRRTGWICVDAAGVRRLVIGRELRAREDRDRPGQDLLSGEVISSGASTRPCGQTGPGTRAVGTAWAARHPCGHGGDELIG